MQEYKQKNKSNQLVDKRFGEKDPGLSVEDKLMQRFVLERKVVMIVIIITVISLRLHGYREGWSVLGGSI